MSEEFSANFITITDEEGRELELEHLDTLEHNGQVYMAFFPAISEDEADAAEDDEEEMGLIILKVVEENGEELLSTLDDEAELSEVFDRFMEEVFQDEDDED